MPLILTAEEREAVAAVLGDTPLSAVVEAWERLVGEIVAGYQFTIDDYTNDLSARDLAERVRCATPAALSSRITERLGGADARFIAATVPALHPLMRNANPDAFWWTRVPRAPGDELLEDLRSLGHCA